MHTRAAQTIVQAIRIKLLRVCDSHKVVDSNISPAFAQSRAVEKDPAMLVQTRVHEAIKIIHDSSVAAAAQQSRSICP
jgi:hypothetical protein